VVVRPNKKGSVSDWLKTYYVQFYQSRYFHKSDIDDMCEKRPVVLFEPGHSKGCDTLEKVHAAHMFRNCWESTSASCGR
jgi:hypothetical protein